MCGSKKPTYFIKHESLKERIIMKTLIVTLCALMASVSFAAEAVKAPVPAVSVNPSAKVAPVVKKHKKHHKAVKHVAPKAVASPSPVKK